MTFEKRGENAEQAHSKTALQARDQAGVSMGNEVSETVRGNQRAEFKGGQDTATAHLPKVELTDASKVGGTPDQRLQLISDRNAKPEERLAAAMGLAKDGVSKIELQNDKGEKYSLRLETAKAGSRDLISIHSAEAGGKERPLLKGVANTDGSIEPQKNSRGDFASWHGSGKELSGSPNDAPPRVHSRHGKTGGQPNTAEQTDKKVEPVKPALEPALVPTLEPAKNPVVEPADKQSGSAKVSPEAKLPEEAVVKPVPKQETKADETAPIDAHKIMDTAAQRAGNPVGKLVKTEDGLYMKGKFAVDADGHPNVKKLDPKHGSLHTTLRYADGDGSVNAGAVPYVVLPKGQFKEHGVKVGDLALVRNTENGALTVAVFGDVGPKHKRGEGSMALARELGLNDNPRYGGTQNKNIEYLAIPNSGGEKARNQQELLEKINSAKQRLGLRG